MHWIWKTVLWVSYLAVGTMTAVSLALQASNPCKEVTQDMGAFYCCSKHQRYFEQDGVKIRDGCTAKADGKLCDPKRQECKCQKGSFGFCNCKP